MEWRIETQVLNNSTRASYSNCMILVIEGRKEKRSNIKRLMFDLILCNVLQSIYGCIKLSILTYIYTNHNPI